MTFEEHVARAMLLDRWYDPRDHTYTMHDMGNTSYMSDYALDAETLEPISIGQWQPRRELVEAGALGFPSHKWPHHWRPE